MEKYKVLVCDDMPYMTSFFASLVNSSEKCECVGTAHNEKEVIALAREFSPDVVLLDIQMDNIDSGITLVPVLLEEHPNVKIIMISVSEDDENIYRSILAGAKDYILKSQPPNCIIESIEQVCSGRHELRSELCQKILSQCEKVENKNKSIFYIINKMMCLSAREMEVLIAFCNGKNYKTCAESLCVEEGTIRSYVNRILKKMQYVRMADLVEDLNAMGVSEILESK